MIILRAAKRMFKFAAKTCDPGEKQPDQWVVTWAGGWRRGDSSPLEPPKAPFKRVISNKRLLYPKAVSLNQDSFLGELQGSKFIVQFPPILVVFCRTSIYEIVWQDGMQKWNVWSTEHLIGMCWQTGLWPLQNHCATFISAEWLEATPGQPQPARSNLEAASSDCDHSAKARVYFLHLSQRNQRFVRGHRFLWASTFARRQFRLHQQSCESPLWLWSYKHWSKMCVRMLHFPCQHFSELT